LHRLRKRNRESENQIDIEYLTKIHLKYEEWIDSLLREQEKKAEMNNFAHDFVRIVDGNKDKQSVLKQIDAISN
jgi:deoxyadenosine/deoxycytidine kinase